MSKLSPGTLILGIFAVLFGLVGAYAAKRYLQRAPQTTPPQPPLRQTVPLASADIPAGRTLTMGDIMLVRMTRDELEERGLPPLFMTNPSQVIGRTLRESAKKGDAFVTTMFYPEGLGPSVAERLQPGYRAVTVPLEENPSELALVTPGMLIDLVFRTTADAMEQVPETTVTLLERVEVLAIGREISQGARAPFGGVSRPQTIPTVTLAVTPDQASALKVVEGHGTMSLAVRGSEDEQVAGQSSPQTLASLLNLPEPEPPFTTQIYRRGRLTTAVFEEGKQTVVTETFTGMPIAAADRGPRVHRASHTLASQTSPGESSSCGCQNETSGN